MAREGFVALAVDTPDGRTVKFEVPVGTSEADIQSLAAEALRKAIPDRQYDLPNIPQATMAKLPQTQDQILARQGNLEAADRTLVDQTGDLIYDATGNRDFSRRAGNFLNDVTPLGVLTYGGDALHDVGLAADRGDAAGVLAGLGSAILTFGTMGKPIPRGGGARGVLGELIRDEAGSFGGRNAATADLRALSNAEQLAAEGADRRRIWDETGWFQGVDGKWRFEIDDSGMKYLGNPKTPNAAGAAASRAKARELGYKNENEIPWTKFDDRDKAFDAGNEVFQDTYRNGTPLPEVISHPLLEAAYPDLANLRVKPISGKSRGFNRDTRGAWDQARTAYVRTSMSAPEKRSTMAHEVGAHYVQGREGFAGGAPSSSPTYWNTAGEVEARNVQRRIDMTADERRAIPPWETQDVPDADQVIANSSGMAMDSSPQGALARVAPSAQAKATARQLASMPGAPMKPITTRQVGKLSENYLDLVDLGKEGAEWYPQSGRAIMEHFGENQPRAVKFTGGVGVTSSDTPVLPNLEYAVRGNDQYMMGDTVYTGRYPTAMGQDIKKIYDGPDTTIDDLVSGVDEPYGPKRTPFIRQNLMYEVNDLSTARSVRDVWDLRARGYTNKDGSTFSGTPTAAAHRWGDVQDQGYIIPEANSRGIGGRSDWDTGRVQAAAWVGKKIESEMAKGKSFEEARDLAITDYSHGWDRMYANHSWESAPGSNTGHMTGFDELPWDVRADYHDRTKEAFLTDGGRSRIALGYGSPAGRSYDSVGLYEGVMSPGTQDLIPVARGTGSQFVDPSSVKKMDAVAATQGLLGAQKAAAWNYLSPVKAPRRPKGAGAGATGYRFDLGRTMTPEDVERYGPQVVETFGDRVGILPDPNGFRISEFWQDGDAPKLVDFVERVEKEIGTKAFPTTHTGNYIENAWDQPSGRFGGDYVGALQRLQIPDMAAKFDSFAPDIARKMVDDIDPAMMRDAGFVGSDDIERLRKTIANEGWSGLVRLVESQKGSVAAKDALLASLAGLGGAGALAAVQTRD